MKKKILSLVLVVALAATAVIGGTLAYFTDTDGATNVMTTGNVKIIQNEQERDGDKLVDFEDDHKLAPYTADPYAGYPESVTMNGESYPMFDQEKNAVDKIVTVTNNGTEDCYVRTLFAWEMIPVKDNAGNIVDWESPFDHGLVISTQNSASGDGMPSWTYDEDDEFGLDVNKGDRVTFDMGGVRYMVSHYYYNDMLAANETSHPSLKQMYLEPTVDNEWYAKVGEEYKVLALSQATQVQGFAADPDVFVYSEAKTALETAFGAPWEVGSAKLVEWFGECVEFSIVG